MTTETHTDPTTAVLRQRLGAVVGRWTPLQRWARRRRPTKRRRWRLVGPMPPALDLWAIDRDELRSALEDSRF